MTRPLSIILALTLSLGMVSCTTPGSISSNDSSGSMWKPFSGKRSAKSSKGSKVVRTTAYTHTESDSLKYGRKNASGSNLKFGRVRSAAADWSQYPVGTVFQVQGEPYVYEVDDYGSALVGTQTIDLYRPSKSSMNAWGVRNVPIRILRWGSYRKSLEILKPRAGHDHVREMVSSIESKRRRV